MFLRRIGNKTKLADKIVSYFPENIHVFFDLFFGTGAISWKMVDRAKYIIANDLDNDIFNLWMVYKFKKDELINELKSIPYHQSIFNFFKENTELNDVLKAARFLYLSNISFLGQSDMMCFGSHNDLSNTINNLIKFKDIPDNIQFTNMDFRKVIESTHFRHVKNYKASFIYADPPYFKTKNNYSNSFTKQDTIDLFEMLVASGLKFAISEFNNPFIIELSNQYNLVINEICTRQSLKKRSTEILITNYVPKVQGNFFKGLEYEL